MNDADRVLRVHLHPMFEGASDREVARIAGVPRAFAHDERRQIEAERGLARVLARADELRDLDGFGGDSVAYLHSLLDRAVIARARTAHRALERVRARRVPPNQTNGGARPPEQSRGASPTRNGDGGPSQDARGSKVTGLGADR